VIFFNQVPVWLDLYVLLFAYLISGSMRASQRLLWSIETGLTLFSVPVLWLPKLKPWATMGLPLSSVRWLMVSNHDERRSGDDH
jgi:hypothetical protein